MFHLILLISFLLLLVYAGIVMVKMLLQPPDKQPDNSAVKDSALHQQPPAAQTFPPAFETDPYYHPPTVNNRQRNRSQSRAFTLLVMVALGYIAYQNRELIVEHLPAKPAEESSAPERQSLSMATVDGHTVVDGVNWFKIVATSTDGVPFEGWVSESAIQNTPPKENKMADEMRKKLGLPTNREQIESLKKLKRVGEALNTALKDVRPKEE